MRIFLAGGESRHWLNTPLIEVQNANILSRRVLQKHGQRNQADCMGGIVPDADILSKSSHNTEIPKRNTNGDYPIRGGYV